MAVGALKAHMLAEAYGPLIREQGSWGFAVGELRISGEDGIFTVGWHDRGAWTDVLLTTADEDAACRCFHAAAQAVKLHFRTFIDPGPAARLTEKLTAEAIEVWRNDIPNFNGPRDARYRVFVHGRDLARAEAIAARSDSPSGGI